jgi:hypothetical protein
MMNALLSSTGLALAGLLLLAVPLAAAQVNGTPVTVEYYYKLAPGGTSEWLALYKKNHNPILKQYNAVLKYGT